MRDNFIRRLRSLGRDSNGTSVIEFALFAPILCVTLMGVTDVSMAYSRKLAVEQAAFRALENVSVTTPQANYDYLRAEAAAADGAGGVQAADVTVTTWIECNNVQQPATTTACPTGQQTSQYVQVSIASSYTPVFFEGPLAATGNANGVVALTASASVRVR